MIINLECLLGMRSCLTDNSIDAVVTDPPYGLSKEPDMMGVMKHWMNDDDYVHTGNGFMGKSWDSFVPGPSIWKEVFRVLKPGGHLLAFFGSRTYDLGTLNIRLAGFEIRDQIMWVYGSGFPKSLNVGEGRGTALKPAHEPICVARKPLSGTVAENVLTHGTGALNIDGCRVGSDIVGRGGKGAGGNTWNDDNNGLGKDGEARPVLGRWPANFVHDGSDDVRAAFPDAKGQQGDLKETGNPRLSSGHFGDMAPPHAHKARIDNDNNAARFFYCAKASKADRDEGVSLAATSAAEMVDRNADSAGMNSPRAGAGRTSGARNDHPTVKPTALMQWLVRLVTPPGGTVLDPFTGSGSTGKACALEGFEFIGFEMDPHYCEIAEQRINKART